MTALAVRHAELVSASILPREKSARTAPWTLTQVQGDEKCVGCFALKILPPRGRWREATEGPRPTGAVVPTLAPLAPLRQAAPATSPKRGGISL
jgi:hypothetical protein